MKTIVPITLAAVLTLFSAAIFWKSLQRKSQ